MKILILHSSYLSGAVSGENRVVEGEAELLRAGGYDVTLLTRSPEGRTEGVALLRTGARSIWSIRAAKEVELLVQEEGFDIVHCHNLFPSFSPSVIAGASRAGAAVVVTLHNYRLLCLPATFWRDGHVCEQCLGHVPWRGVRYRCYRDSLPGSAALAGSLTYARLRRTLDSVTFFVAVSEFVRSKHLEGGISPEQILVKPNFVPAAPRREGGGEYFLYLGRLSNEKDVRLLIDSWCPELGRLVIAGDGPDAVALRSLGERAGVEFIGVVPPAEVPFLLARARALLFPSRSFEGMPRAVLEAYAAGVPVIASDAGALPEVVTENETGLLVAGTREAWAGAMGRLGDDLETQRLGDGAWERWRDRYSPDRGLGALKEVYARALSQKRRGTA